MPKEKEVSNIEQFNIESHIATIPEERKLKIIKAAEDSQDTTSVKQEEPVQKDQEGGKALPILVFDRKVDFQTGIKSKPSRVRVRGRKSLMIPGYDYRSGLDKRNVPHHLRAAQVKKSN